MLTGDTAHETVRKRLAEMLSETSTHESGAALPLARFALYVVLCIMTSIVVRPPIQVQPAAGAVRNALRERRCTRGS
jgi:hypothetical protein